MLTLLNKFATLGCTQNRLKKIEENLEAVTDQVGKLSEDMTEVKRQLKELKDKMENKSNDR